MSTIESICRIIAAELSDATAAYTSLLAAHTTDDPTPESANARTNAMTGFWASADTMSEAAARIMAYPRQSAWRPQSRQIIRGMLSIAGLDGIEAVSDAQREYAITRRVELIERAAASAADWRGPAPHGVEVYWPLLIAIIISTANWTAREWLDEHAAQDAPDAVGRAMGRWADRAGADMVSMCRAAKLIEAGERLSGRKILERIAT
jgi:hypothetical protein